MRGGVQVGEAAPAGDQHGAARRVGQQRAHLLGGRGVVQHHQGPGTGETAAVGGGAGVQVVRDLVAGYPQQTQETVQHGGRVGRRVRPIGVDPAQIDEQHPVERLLPGEEMPGVDGELGLADPGHSGDRGDHHRTTVDIAVMQHPPQPVQLGATAGEPGQVLRQPVLNPDLRRRLALPTDHPQRLTPLRHVAGVRMQRRHHRHDQLGVQPAAGRPEAVHHGGLAYQVTGGPARRGPGGVDPILDPLIRRVTGPDLQQPQPFDQTVEATGRPGVGQRCERVDRLPCR
ncbi:MAG: hypothetical protein QOI74_1403 [Micromonosporaceae bacterium]|nr:hypothetical protein [Micromonosporaceae bacterium]